MTMCFKRIIIFLLITCTLLFAGSVFVESSATPQDNKVSITWRTEAEKDGDQFQVLRSYDDNTFVEIGAINKKGDGSDYEYIDDSVIFKGSQTFFYKIRAVKSNGTMLDETESLIVNPNLSGIYRTWGAIKAMFR